MLKVSYVFFLVVFCFLQSFASVASDSWQFAFAGHLRSKTPDRSYTVNKMLPSLVKAMNTQDVDFLVLGGDLVPGYTDDQELLASQYKSVQSVLGNILVPYYVVPGNHDVFHEESLQLWKKHWGEDVDRYFEHKNAFFIMIGSYLSEQKGDKIFSEEYKGFYQESIYDFLQNALEIGQNSSNVENIFLILHHNLWSDVAVLKDDQELWFRKYHELLKQYNKVNVVFSGNGNNYLQFYEFNGIKYVTHGWPSLDHNDTREPLFVDGANYLSVDVNGGSVDVQVKPLNLNIVDFLQLKSHFLYRYSPLSLFNQKLASTEDMKAIIGYFKNHRKVIFIMSLVVGIALLFLVFWFGVTWGCKRNLPSRLR